MPNWGTIYPSGYVDGGNDENHSRVIFFKGNNRKNT